MNKEFFEEKRDNFLVSTDNSKLDINVIYNYLTNSYWAEGIPFDTVKISIDNSVCFSVYEDVQQVGFARVITDKATIAYLGDVFILESHRGKGLSKWLMECIMKHPELQGFRRWILLTRDAHELYMKYGFKELTKPQRYMELTNHEVYKKR